MAINVFIRSSGMSGSNISATIVPKISQMTKIRLFDHLRQGDISGIQYLLRNRDISIYNEDLVFVSVQVVNIETLLIVL